MTKKNELSDPHFWVGYFGSTLARIAAEGNDDAARAVKYFVASPYVSTQKDHMKEILITGGTS